MPVVALFSWPFIALLFFVFMGPRKGLIWTFLIGYLFLPEAYGFDLPGLPPYEKATAIGLSCVLGLFVCHLRGQTPGDGAVVYDDHFAQVVFRVLIALLFFGALATVLTNRSPLIFGGRAVVPGLGLRDYISIVSDNIMLLIPFLAARQYLYDERAHRDLAVALLACGIGYSMLALFEARMSPQLNQWIYGYFQHTWNQHVRAGGWRPIIFLAHGLQVGFFLFAATIAAIGLVRSNDEGQSRWGYFLVASWIFMVLFISRNLGALAIGIMFVPIALLLGARAQVRIATVIAVIVLSFPALRYADVIPLQSIVSFSEKISPDRAGSLRYRIEHEDDILEHAVEKPVFGWGVWARWRVRDEVGNDISVVDGLWIGTYGEWGWAGYLALYGLLTAPLFLIARNFRRRIPPGATIGLMMIVAGNLIYTIPNSAGGPFIWLIAGALAGFAQRHTAPQEVVAEESGPERRVRYTRFEPGVVHPSRSARS